MNTASQTIRVRHLLIAALSLGAAGTSCSSSRTDPPNVQGSSTQPRNTDVKITASLSFSPNCTTIRTHQTVEWWVDEDAPDVPVNVTSLGSPIELYSPNLAAPLACDSSVPKRVCWRHTFTTAGCFQYYDTNSGSPGRPVVDDYYGTVTYVGESGDVSKGLVCVADDDSCDGICCNSNFDCDDGYRCDSGHCVRASDGEPSPCPNVTE